METQTLKGKILYKNITPTRFAVTYQCSCGAEIEFRLEEKKTCRACHAIYQLRVMVGKMSKPSTTQGSHEAPLPPVVASSPAQPGAV